MIPILITAAICLSVGAIIGYIVAALCFISGACRDSEDEGVEP